MTICDLCEGRIDVIACRIELPFVKQSGNGSLDLCMDCQKKVFVYISASVGNKKTESPVHKKGTKP